MPLDDPNQQPITNAADSPTNSLAPGAPVPPTQPSQPAPNPANNGQPSGPVSNALANDPSQHPSVQKAGLLRTIAETLAGGPRYSTSINPQTGATVRTPVPLSKADIGLAIAMEALSGGLAGLSQKGPGAIGRAGEAGLEKAAQERQQADAQQQAATQQQFENQSKALAQKAATYEVNSRTLLNVANASKLGEEAIKDLIGINRASGVLDIDPAFLENGGQPMSEQDVAAGMKDGTINVTSHLGPVAGFTIVNDANGTPHILTEHLVVKDSNTPVTLTPEDWKRYEGLPGFPANTKISANGVQVPLRMKQQANEQLATRTLANYRLDGLKAILDGTPFADRVPTKVDFTVPGTDRAWTAYSRYTSHDAENSADPFLALKAMSAAKRNADGTMTPNPDARFADTLAASMGGWSVLEAAHNQLAANQKVAADFAVIDSDAKANAVIASPKRFTLDQIQAAKSFIALSNEQGAKKAAQAARERAIAEGTDVQAMYRFGRNPITGEVLSLDNAAPSMLVTPSGQVIPQDLVSTYKPSAQEKQTADTARQVLAISASLQAELNKNPNLAGPLSGRSKSAIAKLGYGDAQAQKFLDDISFLQSAATKMHTGRFSNEILKKMGSLIQPGMNPDQFGGALSSINDVASRYADEDKLTTVADFKQKAATPMNQTPANGRQVQIPAGAQIGRDGQGRIVGYKLPNGQYVPLGGSQ
jgi:hypothetical protein